MASAEEGPEPLKYQTLALKVSIHCEGCEKKVKKILQSIEGVYKTTIDSQQQKVVVTGNVQAETLIKKILKTGKHAELWPEKKPNNPGNNNNNSGGGGGKKNKNKNEASAKPNELSENPDDDQTHKASGDDPSSDSSAKPDGEAPKNGGKKKGKKGQKENNGGGGGGEVQVVSEEMNSEASGVGGVGSPAFNYPVYPTWQLPGYVVSYSSVQPSASYGGAYHPMSMNQSSYFYSGAAAAAAAPLSYYINDENLNACRIM